MSLGNKLRYLRLKERKTLSQQGKILNVSMNSVYRWEHGLAVPRITMLKKMAGMYGIPADWLLSDISTESLKSEVEQNLLTMFRGLSDMNKFKVIGIIRSLDDEIDMD